MAFRLAVKVPPNSATLEEARRRTFDLFRTACRSIPKIMDVYNLYDVVTVSQLRSTIATEIRKNAHITNPKVIDMLIFKATEELGNIVEHAKQRHHIIGQYVVGRHRTAPERKFRSRSLIFSRNFTRPTTIESSFLLVCFMLLVGLCS